MENEDFCSSASADSEIPWELEYLEYTINMVIVVSLEYHVVSTTLTGIKKAELLLEENNISIQ